MDQKVPKFNLRGNIKGLDKMFSDPRGLLGNQFVQRNFFTAGVK